MNVSIYISEFFSCLICLCECIKHEWSVNNMWLFFLFFPILLSTVFLTLPKNKKETISLPPSSLFLFLLIQDRARSESVRTIVPYSSDLLGAAHVWIEALFSMRKDISLYSVLSQLLCWPYVFFPFQPDTGYIFSLKPFLLSCYKDQTTSNIHMVWFVYT